jgi:hypothetical protein
MYGFGAEDEGVEPQIQEQQGPAWFRSYMDKVSGQLSELKAENDRLKDSQRQAQVAEALKAQGYAPQAAGLYTGTPDKLTDWLGTHGAALARIEAAQEGAEVEGQTQSGTPATVVSAESQAAMAAISGAGQGGAGPLSGDDQLAARLEAAQTQEEFNAIMSEAGNVRFR